MTYSLLSLSLILGCKHEVVFYLKDYNHEQYILKSFHNYFNVI